MLGKILITASALAQSFGSFIADFNDTHVTNPRWPPHARFHNGQTMSMSLALTVSTLYYTWRSTSNPAVEKDSIFTAALLGSLYYVTGLSAILYPGSKGVDPEFGEGFPQFWIFTGLGSITWLGWWLERSMNFAANARVVN